MGRTLPSQLRKLFQIVVLILSIGHSIAPIIIHHLLANFYNFTIVHSYPSCRKNSSRCPLLI